MHDVTVTNNGTFTLAKAFDVEAPIEVESSIAQGSWSQVKIRNLDTTHPFDPTPGPVDGDFANLSVTTTTGVTVRPTVVGLDEIDAIVRVDLDAPSVGTLTINNGPPGASVASTVSVPITARTAIPLAGTTTVAIASTTTSSLYSIAAVAPSEIDFTIAASNMTGLFAEPVVVMLGRSGHWSDAILSTQNGLFADGVYVNSLGTLVTQDGPFYAIAFDGARNTGYDLSITAHSAPMVSIAEAATTQTTGQVVSTLPALTRPRASPPVRSAICTSSRLASLVIESTP